MTKEKAVAIAETFLRKRDRNLEVGGGRARKMRQLMQESKTRDKSQKFISAHKILREAKCLHDDKQRVARVLSTQKAVPPRASRPERRLLLVVRNKRGTSCPAVTKALVSLGINKKDLGRFVMNTDEARACLQLIDPFVFYGTPSFELARSVLRKRGNLISSDDVIPLSDNTAVEERLGEKGMLCIEDVFHELWSGGEHAEATLAELGPFRMDSIKEAEGLDAPAHVFGNLKDDINSKLRKIL